MRLTLLLFISAITSCVTTYKPKEPSIVRLLTKDKRFMCSGTVVDKDKVLTAAHCLGAEFVQSDTNRNIMVPITGKHGNDRLDIAVVIADVSKFSREFLEISPTEILSTTYKRACGFPAGGEIYCTNFKDNKRAHFQFKCEVDSYPGMSGGPISSRWTGRVIGVISAVDADGDMLWPPATELWLTIGMPQ